MTLQIANDPHKPVVCRIVDAVSAALQRGELTPGEKLPPRLVLARQLGVNATTVGQAYARLEMRGLVVSRRGSGTYVSDAADRAVAGSPAALFPAIILVVGESSLARCRRHTLRQVADITEGMRQVAGIGECRFEFAASLDQSLLQRLTGDEAVLLVRTMHADPAVADELLQRRFPALSVWATRFDLTLPRVSHDHHQAARLAMEHLLDCGYQRIGFIGEMGRNMPLAAKFFEFTNVLAQAGRDFQIRHVCEVSGDQPAAAGFAAHRLAQNRDLPDAFFVDNDYKAMEVIAGLNEAGVKVPDDVGVIGHDDIPEAARWADPPLTTVRTPRHAVGQRAGEMLRQWAEAGTPLHTNVLTSELIVRDSTRAASTHSSQQVKQAESAS